MKGLILKDCINLKKNMKIMGAMALLYGFMAFTSKDASFFSTIFTFLFAILTISIYSYDDMAKWDAYALTMPISKDNVVQGKYIMMLLLTVTGIIFSMAFSAIIDMATGGGKLIDCIESCCIGAGIVILFYCIILPFVTKLGVEKARLVFFAVYIIPFVIIVAVNKAVKAGNLTIPANLTDIINFTIKYVYIMLPVIVLVSLAISYLISVNIYRRKEF